MDVNNLKPMDRANVNSTSASSVAAAVAGTAPANQVAPSKSADTKSTTPKAEQRTEDIKDIKDLSYDELLPISQELNKFMTYLNADIQFSLHEKTQQLVVKVVDTKENKVLREFPPEELLDTIANIREYIGVLLDKKV